MQPVIHAVVEPTERSCAEELVTMLPSRTYAVRHATKTSARSFTIQPVTDTTVSGCTKQPVTAATVNSCVLQPTAKPIWKGCCVPICDSKRVRMHKFPKDFELGQRWLQAVRNPAFKAIPYQDIRSKYGVCYKHFADKNVLVTSAGMYKVLSYTMPTLCLPKEDTYQDEVMDEACISLSNQMPQSLKDKHRFFNPIIQANRVPVPKSLGLTYSSFQEEGYKHVFYTEEQQKKEFSTRSGGNGLMTNIITITKLAKDAQVLVSTFQANAAPTDSQPFLDQNKNVQIANCTTESSASTKSYSTSNISPLFLSCDEVLELKRQHFLASLASRQNNITKASHQNDTSNSSLQNNISKDSHQNNASNVALQNKISKAIHQRVLINPLREEQDKNRALEAKILELKTKLSTTERRCKRTKTAYSALKVKYRETRKLKERYDSLNERQRAMVDMILHSKDPPSSARYTDVQKELGLSMYKMSPQLYRFMCESIRLPSKSTLKSIERLNRIRDENKMDYEVEFGQ